MFNRRVSRGNSKLKLVRSFSADSQSSSHSTLTERPSKFGIREKSPFAKFKAARFSSIFFHSATLFFLFKNPTAFSHARTNETSLFPSNPCGRKIITMMRTSG